MESRSFLDEKTKSTEKKLKKVLNNSYVNYKELIKDTNSFLKDWNFSKNSGWMKEDNIMIACCTDAIRPVTFKIERIEA